MKPTVENLSRMLLANNAIKYGFYRSKVKADPGWCPAYSTVLGNNLVSCECYGIKAMIYIRYDENNIKEKIIDVCSRNEIEYSDHGYRIEIRVRSFKGWHWWE